MKYMEQIGMRSKAASRSIGLLGQNRRNEALKQAAKELKKQAAILTGRESKRHCECERKRNEGISYRPIDAD